jgi:aspartyl-tRNA(Asn)/glutamyl-tRNA(Gln) amidotransferase subunit C
VVPYPAFGSTDPNKGISQGILNLSQHSGEQTMAVDRAEIEKIATLARIKLEDSAIPQITKSITDILALVETMQDIDTSDVEPMANPLDAKQRLRADEVTESNQREALQSQAPEAEEGLFLVPKVIE